MNFDLNYIEKLAKLLKDNDLSEITIDGEEQAISLKREFSQVAAVAPMLKTTPAIKTEQNIKSEVKSVHRGKPITSPMVGTFYSSPSPDEPPFVGVGDSVSSGQVVCIIEAMKLMNEIESDISGKITEICIKNGETVEFGQTLMYIE